MFSAFVNLCDLCGYKNRYNIAVPDDPNARVRRAEALGLFVLALLLAMMILARWGGVIPWSAR